MRFGLLTYRGLRVLNVTTSKNMGSQEFYSIRTTWYLLGLGGTSTVQKLEALVKD